MIYDYSYYNLSFEERIKIENDYYVYVSYQTNEHYYDIRENLQKIDKDLVKTSKNKDIKIYMGTEKNKHLEEIHFCIERNKQKRRDMRTFYIKLLIKILTRNINN